MKIYEQSRFDVATALITEVEYDPAEIGAQTAMILDEDTGAPQLLRVAESLVAKCAKPHLFKNNLCKKQTIGGFTANSTPSSACGRR